MYSPSIRSASLALPLTQNTAQVFEFKCLYTHDLQRKQKRWQDGYLSFHTFNKRVMVYDTSRNHIGDTYVREVEFISEGDELRLDRGVLIQVTEASGSREQDINTIIQIKRSPQRQPTAQNLAHGSVLSATASPSDVEPVQMRPKTLRAVLGTAQRTYSRANLPKQSPFEKRQQMIPQEQLEQSVLPFPIRSDQAQPPAKRQRLSTQEEFRDQTPPRGHLLPRLNSRYQTSNIGSRQAVPIQQAPPEKTISLESGEDLWMTSNLVRAQSPSALPEVFIKDNRVKATRKHTKLLEKAQHPAHGNRSSAKNVRPEPSVSSVEPDHTEDRPMNILRCSSANPRKKLLYRALLPPTANKPESAVPVQELAERQEAQMERSPVFSNATQDFASAQRERLKSRQDRRQKQKNHSYLKSSQLSEEGFQDWVDPPSKVETKEAEAVVIDEAIVDASTVQRSSSRSPESKISGEPISVLAPVEHTPLRRRKPTVQLPTTAFAKLSKAKANAPSESIPAMAIRSSERIQAICQHPTNNPLSNIALPPLHRAIPPSNAQKDQVHPAYPRPRRLSLLEKAHSEIGKPVSSSLARAGIQRSMSDMSGARPRPSAPASSVRRKGTEKNGGKEAQREREDTGPWSREAFDLFGWRPGDPKGIGDTTGEKAT